MMAGRVGYWNVAGLIAEVVNPAVKAGLHNVGVEARRQGQNFIRQPKHGKMSRQRGTRTKYRASAPGESPASPTGKFFNQILFEVAEDGSSVRIGPSPRIAGAWVQLDQGYLMHNRKKMRVVLPRPTLERVIENTASLANAFEYGCRTGIRRK